MGHISEWTVKVIIVQRCKYYKEKHIALLVASEGVEEPVRRGTYLIMLLGLLGLPSCPEPEAGSRTDFANMVMYQKLGEWTDFKEITGSVR
jgi:hypothetical protein